MSEASEDLAALLELLAHETYTFDGDQRLLESEDLFTSVLELIDQTVIPTLIEISNGQRVLRLEVAGRRLSYLPGVIENLSADDEKGLATAAEVIATFIDAAEGALRVRELASDAGDADPAQSVSIKALAAVAGRQPVDQNVTPLTKFRARLDGAIVAGQVMDGTSEVTAIGDTAAYEASFAELANLIGDADTPHLILLEVDDKAAPLHGAIRIGTGKMMIATNGLSIAEIVSAFKASIPT